jgi:hypothetical protein
MSNLIGFEEDFRSLLENINNNTLGNSLLISGSKGIGKSLFIKTLFEEFIKSRVDNENINHHISLLKNNTHPNVSILKKEIDEKTKKIKNFITIDQIRKLNQFSRETSINNNLPKFILIDSADDLNTNAANALLKILEEPKPNTYFFLLSHQSFFLLPTIKSRCLKINLPNHNFTNFKNILIYNNTTDNEDIIKFLFDITNGCPGLSSTYNLDEFLSIFDKLTYSITDLDSFSDDNKYLTDLFSSFANEKMQVFFSILKFILFTLAKTKHDINILDYYQSSNVKNILKVSDNVSLDLINKKLEYLINNENDLFTYNLDKKIFMINFFAEQ